MKYKRNQKVLKFYAKNPKVCKMLIKIDSDNKLLARALLWSTDKGGYMDRIYYVNDYDKNLFEIYAKNKGLLTHSKDDYDKDLTVKLEWWKKKGNEDDYPYMDSFSYLNTHEGLLYSNDFTSDYDLYLDYH